MTEREFAISVVERLQQAGFEALWAGGCVRDELLGLVPKDYDIASTARPEEVQKTFRKTVAVGAAFGVIEVLGPRVDGQHLKVQVATFRSDQGYSDGRRPDSVTFTSAREDALRRDFTINGMFFDPLRGQLIDYVGGQEDLQTRVLRAIGDPHVRFDEDKLRMLRAVRIATRFDLVMEPTTIAAIRQMAPQLRVVSAERIAEELRQLLIHPRRVRGLNLLREMELLAGTFPEAIPMIGLPQGTPSRPTGDLWSHVMRVLDYLGPTPSFPLALATFLHDVGKPRTMKQLGDKFTFYHHEHVGAKMAQQLGRRLRLSNAEAEKTVWLVDRHQYLCDAKQMRTHKLKMMLSHPEIHELLALHRADALATGTSVDHVDYCEFLLREWSPEEINPPPLLTGHDLTRYGFTPGPGFKIILDRVREAQLDGTIRSVPDALVFAENVAAEHGIERT